MLASAYEIKHRIHNTLTIVYPHTVIAHHVLTYGKDWPFLSGMRIGCVVDFIEDREAIVVQRTETKRGLEITLEWLPSQQPKTDSHKKSEARDAIWRAVVAMERAILAIEIANAFSENRGCADGCPELRQHLEGLREWSAMADQGCNPPPWVANPPRHEITPFLAGSYAPAGGASEN